MEQRGRWAKMNPLPLTWCKYLPSVSWISQPRDDWSVFGEHLSYWHPLANCVRQPDKIKSLDAFLFFFSHLQTSQLLNCKVEKWDTLCDRDYIMFPCHAFHAHPPLTPLLFYRLCPAWGASVGFPSLAGSRDKGMCQNKRIRSSSVWGTHGWLKEAQSIHTE